MNIFLLDSDIEKCTEYMVNSHIVKMITEHAQMLSTTVRLNGFDVGYKITHENHPCTKWVRTSLSNWLFLRELTECMHHEWQYRYDHPSTHIHKAFEIIKTLPLPNIPDIGLTPFAQAMPEKYQHKDTVVAYRNFYNGDKRHLFKWKKRETPPWIKDKVNG